MTPTADHAARGVPGVTTSSWRRRCTLVAAITVALLPKCPACWSVYAGLSSVLGLSFVVEAAYLLPLTAGLLLLTVAALALPLRSPSDAGARRVTVARVLLGGLSAACLLLGKFAFDSALLTHLSLFGLAGAWLWGSWAALARRRQLVLRAQN